VRSNFTSPGSFRVKGLFLVWLKSDEGLKIIKGAAWFCRHFSMPRDFLLLKAEMQCHKEMMINAMFLLIALEILKAVMRI
jgi:hypothetical protein